MAQKHRVLRGYVYHGAQGWHSSMDGRPCDHNHRSASGAWDCVCDRAKLQAKYAANHQVEQLDLEVSSS